MKVFNRVVQEFSVREVFARFGLSHVDKPLIFFSGGKLYLSYKENQEDKQNGKKE